MFNCNGRTLRRWCHGVVFCNVLQALDAPIPKPWQSNCWIAVGLACFQMLSDVIVCFNHGHVSTIWTDGIINRAPHWLKLICFHLTCSVSLSMLKKNADAASMSSGNACNGIGINVLGEIANKQRFRMCFNSITKWTNSQNTLNPHLPRPCENHQP